MQQKQRVVAESLASAMASGCVGARVDRLHRLVVREFEQRLRPSGLSLPQLEILSALTLHPEPVRPAVVAEILAIERSTMSRNLALLQDRGLVQASSTSKSGRSLTVAITAGGTTALADAEHAWTETQDLLLERLGPDAASVLDTWLTALTGHGHRTGG